MKKRLATLVLSLPLLFVGVAVANGQETCPEGDGWVKVDGLSGLIYTFDVPEGYEVADNCYKASTTVVYGSGDTVESSVWNKDDCPGARGCNLQELSHASFRLVKIDNPPEEEPEEPEQPRKEDVPAEEPQVQSAPSGFVGEGK